MAGNIDSKDNEAENKKFAKIYELLTKEFIRTTKNDLRLARQKNSGKKPEDSM